MAVRSAMAPDPIDTEPAQQDPRERDLRRRSATPAAGPWLIIGVIVLLAVGAYVVFALN